MYFCPMGLPYLSSVIIIFVIIIIIIIIIMITIKANYKILFTIPFD